MSNLIEEARDLQDELVKHRHYLHRHPELGMELPKTTAYVVEQLQKMGYEPQEICPSGVLATAGGKQDGKVILIRGDMDALPITEETDEPFKSTNDAMHACGHDMHTAMLLGAAKILKSHEEEIRGTVKLMFQPGEEILQGAAAMIEAGILENPKVDMSMMIHVATGMPMPAGLFLSPEAGSFSATSDHFSIDIQGKGGHGAMPEMAIDPLIPASHIHLGLQTILSREMSASSPVVVTIGKYTGGHAGNIIPDTASLEGTIRTFDNEHRAYVRKRIPEIVEGIAAAYRCTAEVAYTYGCPSVTVPAEGAEDYKEIMTGLFGERALIAAGDVLPGGKLMGSEDFAFVTEQVPGIMTALSAGDAREGYRYPQHHPKAIFNDEILHRGAAAYAGFALQWLKKRSQD